MKKLLYFILTLFILSFVTSFMLTVSAAEPITITVWFHSGKGEEREVLDAQVEDFNAMQDEVVVDPVRLPEGSYNEQVSAASLAGDCRICWISMAQMFIIMPGQVISFP